MSIAGSLLQPMFVSQLSNPHPQIRAVVVDAFSWCLAYDGLALTEEILQQAIEEGDKYPTLTISEFLAGLQNRQLQDGLRKF